MSSKIVLIAGGTASGKTTIAKAIAKAFKNEVVTIQQDLYYRKDWDKLSLEQRLKNNFDHPDAFDWDLIEKDIKDLQEGKVVERPKYIYSEARHSKTKVVKMHPKPVIIFEGLYALFYKDIRNMSSVKLFVDAEDDIRILRRLKRDTYIYEETVNGKEIEPINAITKFSKNWVSVIREMHINHIFPTKKYADLIIPNNNDNGINDNALILLEASVKDMLK